MLSRVAESIYWMSRYLERAENVARFVDVNLHMMLDSRIEVQDAWDPLVKVTGDHELFTARHGEPSERNVVRFLTFDAAYPNSIVACLRAARENARGVREIISSEMWEQINVFYMMVISAENELGAHGDLHEFYDRVKRASHLFWGVTEATMSHGEGWHFSRLGRLLERADKTSRILDVKYFILLPRLTDVGTPFDNLQWAALLKSASALEMYRKRYRRIQPRHVAEFLILDREFPRAIHYCLMKAEESLHTIAGTVPGTFRNRAEQHLGRLRSELDYTEIDEIIDRGLHEYLDDLQKKLNAVGQTVHDTYFALRPASDLIVR